jgi:uncharacterized membrane protein
MRTGLECQREVLAGATRLGIWERRLDRTGEWVISATVSSMRPIAPGCIG